MDKKKKMLWEFVSDIKCGGNYSNRWDLRLFTILKT